MKVVPCRHGVAMLDQAQTFKTKKEAKLLCKKYNGIQDDYYNIVITEKKFKQLKVKINKLWPGRYK